MSQCKALIFDLGKVVFDLSFDRVYQSWATATGRQFEDIKCSFVFDKDSDDFEKGLISEEHFRASVKRRLDIELSDADFDTGWCNLYLDKYSGVDNLLAGLSKRYRLVALTNTNSIHNKVWRIKYADTLTYFDKIFSSHELQTRKPEREIYNLVLDYLHLAPAQTVFLDDNIDNIKGAEKLGIPCIPVQCYDQMIEELRKLELL